MASIYEPPPEGNAPNQAYGAGCGCPALLAVLFVLLMVGYSGYTLLARASSAEVPAGGVRTQAKISWYWPPLGGANCARFKDGVCISNMASGLPWAKWVGRALACPKEFPFGTEFIIDGRTWVCLDRGGAIKRLNENLIWLDLLVEKPLYRYGTVVDVIVVYK